MISESSDIGTASWTLFLVRLSVHCATKDRLYAGKECIFGLSMSQMISGAVLLLNPQKELSFMRYHIAAQAERQEKRLRQKAKKRG